MKILVVDDSRIMRQIVIRTLRHAGYGEHDIVQAQDGRDALAKAESEEPDLVLCDWHMPQMTGLECLQALRCAGSTAAFGLVTSDDSPGLHRQATAAGAQFVICKPFTEEDFRAALAPVLGPAQAPEQDQPTEQAEPHAGASETALLPAAKDLRDTLTGLLAREVTVSPGRRVLPSAHDLASVATYVDKGLETKAVVLMDLALSAYSAGALALLAPGGVNDAVEDRELTPTLSEALHEVTNVLSKAVSGRGAAHLRMHELYLPGVVLPEHLLVAASGFDRLDLLVNISGYGSGAISIVNTG